MIQVQVVVHLLFADLTGMIADGQVPAAFTRDAELSAYALLANAIGVSDLT